MMGKRKVIVALAVIITLLHFCFVLNSYETKNWFSSKINAITSLAVSEESNVVYEVPDNASIPIDNLQSLLNYEIEGLIYFGRDTCPVCLHFNQLLNKLKDSNNDVVVYKFDTDIWREDESFQIILDQYCITEIPAIIYVSGGGFAPFEPNQIMDIDALEDEFFQFLEEVDYK